MHYIYCQLSFGTTNPQAMIEMKLELCARRQGGIILLEGDFGLGKTSLLARFVSDVSVIELVMYSVSNM
jgi:tRNA A37 threonylcarbamoyladenosine biosynthesis protein TsaE